MSQRYQHSRYPPRPNQYNPNRFEHDRWNRDDRRGSPRSYSPARDRRDSRDFGPRDGPRDIDTDRAQRHPRDGGPGSAGSNISDPTRFSTTTFRGSSYSGRGRGGRDWGDRGRTRTYGPDDRERDSFRPRSRSRPRNERDRSVDSRDFDRRERDDYRREDDWHYRRARPDERDFGRRDVLPRADVRHPDARPGDGSRGVSPIDRPRQPSPHRRPSPDLKRDFDTPRRQSTIGDGLPLNTVRRDMERAESNNLRPDPSRERPVARPSEAETHSSVAVPQFGSIPLSAAVVPPKVPVTPTTATPKTPVISRTSPESAVSTSLPGPSDPSPSIPNAPQSSEPSRLEAKAPVQIPANNSTEKPRSTSTIPTTPSVPTSPMLAKVPPTAPRAQLGFVNPPTAPKADRIAEKERVPSIHKEPYEPVVEDPKPREQLQPCRPPPTFLTTLVKPDQSVYDMPPAPRNIPVGSPVMHQRLAPPSAPTGPRGTGTPTFARAASAGPLGRDASPSQTPSTSIGLRGNPTLINGLPSNVPTGPKADRTPRIPPTAPRMQQKLGGRPPTSLQWRANNQTTPIRTPMIPAKRDANGDEKERAHSSERPVDFAGRGMSFSAEPKIEAQASIFSMSRKPSNATDGGDVHMMDAPAARSPEALAFDTDDDDMELDEDDFQEQAARYKAKKAELESQYTDLAEHWQRVAVLIEESDRLRGILSIINELPLPDHPPQQLQVPVVESTHIPSDITNVEEVKPEEELETPPKIKEKEKSPSESHLGSPDLACLPYLAQRPPTPLSNPDHEMDMSEDEVKSLLIDRLHEIETEQAGLQDNLRQEFTERYRPWKRTTDAFRRHKEHVEAAAAAAVATQNTMDVDIVEPVVEVAPAPLLTPNAERRRHFTSALDLQRVLEESRQEEEARLEKAEREAREARASAEREATIPVLLSNEDLSLRTFKDTSLLRKAEEALRVFEYAPPADTFTEDEDRRLRDEYDQGTKMWHKIADAVGRTTKECINHYYATKWDQPYKRQKHKKRRTGPKKGQARRIETELAPQDTTIGLTETGRPRRAAAPTFSKNEKAKPEDGDTDTTGTTKKGGNTKTGDPPTGEEKVARGRRPAKEKQSKKPRGQPLASKAGPSPQKAVKEKQPKDKLSVPEPMVSGPEMPIPPQQPIFNQERLMPALMATQPTFVEPQISVLHNKPDLAPPPPMVTLPTATIPAPVTERPRSHSQSQRQGPSSYWSVPEEAEFKECLKYYGTDFNAIATHMGKKTAVMIKNHFAKYRQDEVKHADLLMCTQQADERKKAGLPPPPMPASLRKRNDHPLLMTPSRNIIPTTELMDTDSPPSGSLNESPHFHPQGRMQILQQQQVVSAPHGYPNQGIAAPLIAQQKQPRMGYFQDLSPSKSQAQPTTQSQMSPTMMPNMTQAQEPRSAKQVGRIKTEYEPQSRPTQIGIREQEARPTALQAAMQVTAQVVPEPHGNTQRIAEPERPLTGLMPFPGGPQPNLGPNIRPMMQEGPMGHPNAPQQRHVVDLTGPPALQQVPVDHMGRPVRPHSPSMREYPAGGVFPQQQSNVPPPSQPPVSRPREAPVRAPPAPSRKVNIMSMLNPEPAEEERPRKKEPERALPPSQPPQHQITEQYGSQQDHFHDNARRGHRPMFSGSHHPMPTEPSNPGPSRDSWSGRQSFAQTQVMPGHSDSPHMQHAQTHGVGPDMRTGSRDFRGPMGSISHQRAVPSPPPGRFAHSRTSSYSQQPVPGAPPTGPNGPPPESYTPGVRGGYAPPHSQGPPTVPRGAPIHPSHGYPGGYPEQGMMPGGQIDPRSRDPSMRSAGGYRREYEIPPSRDQRDPRDVRDRREMPPQHLYQHVAHNHGSPHPPPDNRYAPPPRATHTPLGQGYPGDARGMEGPPRGYEGPPPPHEPRDRHSEWFNEDIQRRMHPRR